MLNENIKLTENTWILYWM